MAVMAEYLTFFQFCQPPCFAPPPHLMWHFLRRIDMVNFQPFPWSTCTAWTVAFQPIAT